MSREREEVVVWVVIEEAVSDCASSRRGAEGKAGWLDVG